MARYSNYENAAVYVALASVLVSSSSSQDCFAANGPFQIFNAAERDLPISHPQTQSLANRLSVGLRCKYPAYVLALLYLRKIKELPSSVFSITTNSFQRVVATAAVVAGKFFDDVYYSNEHYASELGFELSVLNEMEMCLIVMLNYELQIDPAVFNHALSCYDRSRLWYCQSQKCDAFSGLGTSPLPCPAELLVALSSNCCDINLLPVDRQKAIFSFWESRTRSNTRFETEEEHLCKATLQIKAKCINKLLTQVVHEFKTEKAKHAAAPPTCNNAATARLLPNNITQRLKATAAAN